jgi:hypothetical protein
MFPFHQAKSSIAKKNFIPRRPSGQSACSVLSEHASMTDATVKGQRHEYSVSRRPELTPNKFACRIFSLNKKSANEKQKPTSNQHRIFVYPQANHIGHIRPDRP